MGIGEKSFQIRDLVKAKKFMEALDVYQNDIRPNFKVNVIREDEFLVSELLHAFYKTEKFLDALNFVRDLKIPLNKNMPEYGIKMYGWSIYQLLKQSKKNRSSSEENDSDMSPSVNNHEDQQTLNDFLASEAIKVLSIINLHDEDHYLLFSKLFFKLAEYLNNHRNPNWDSYIKLIEKIPYKSFHRIGDSRIINGKTRQFASDLERWYLVTCKSYYLSGNYEKCIQNGNEALNTFASFTSNNKVWIKRSMALSFYKLENYLETIRIYEEDILIKKNDWYLYKELSEIYQKFHDLDMALKYGIYAALIKGEFDLKCNLFQQIGEILFQKGERELGEKHVLLNYFIRTKNDWKINEGLSKQVENLYLSPQDYNLETLHKEVSEYWDSFLLTGLIAKTIPNKRIGWIQRDNQDYFFKFAFSPDSPSKIKEGKKVLFLIGKGLDRKNNQIKDEIRYFRVIS